MSNQSLAIRIARRYLFSRKSHAAVNVLSYISMAGVAIASMAMVIVLSVFNGFSKFTEQKISDFSAPLTVSPASVKNIANADSLVNVISGISGVSSATPMITERAFAVADDRQSALILCGIDPEGYTAQALNGLIIDGEAVLETGDGFYPATAISSIGVANNLHAFPAAMVDVKIYEPRRNVRLNPANPLAAFRCDTIIVAGVYNMGQNEYDTDYLFVPLSFARNILGYTTEATSIEVGLSEGADINTVAKAISATIGLEYKVADRIEQQQDAFRMINVEKWITLVMLTFILIVATFNVLSIMSIMIIEKRGNSGILMALGATRDMIKSVFGWLGLLTTAVGGVIGVIVGVILSLLQQHFGFIKLYADDPGQLQIEAYPVSVSPTDILIVLGVILAIGLLTASITRLLLRNRPLNH